MVKKPPADAGDIRDTSSIPGSGRSPGRESGYPLQYSCLENPMDRGAWWATVHGVSKSQTRLKQVSMHTCERGLLWPNTTTARVTLLDRTATGLKAHWADLTTAKTSQTLKQSTSRYQTVERTWLISELL